MSYASHIVMPRIFPGMQFRSRIISREEQESIEHLPVQLALRMSSNIYKTLIAELFMEGCEESAKYFQCLKDYEDELYVDAFINKRVSDDKQLLLSLFENAKAAEQVSKLKHYESSVTCYKLLYLMLRTVKNRIIDFDWLNIKIFDIIVQIADKYNTKNLLNDEIRAKIYCSYAILQSKSDIRFDHAVEYYNKALQLCRGQCWRSDDITNVFDEFNLHELTAISFAKLFTKYARSHLQMNPQEGLILADKAIICVAEVSQRSMIVLLLETILIKVCFLVELKNYDAAQKQLLMAHRRMRGNTTPGVDRCRCEALIYTALCYKRFERPKIALMYLKQACALGRSIGATKFVALALLDMGKLYISHLNNEHRAHQTLSEARRLFTELRDFANTKRAVYMLGKMESQAFYPMFFNLIKRTDISFCDRYTLRRWKFLGEPFWNRQAYISNKPHFARSTTHMYKDIDSVFLPQEIYNKRLRQVRSNMEWLFKHNLKKSETSFSFSSEETSSEVSSDPIACLLREGKLFLNQIPNADKETNEKIDTSMKMEMDTGYMAELEEEFETETEGETEVEAADNTETKVKFIMEKGFREFDEEITNYLNRPMG